MDAVGAVDALVEEAAKKAAVAWIAVGSRPARLVWCAWLGGALLVVTATDSPSPSPSSQPSPSPSSPSPSSSSGSSPSSRSAGLPDGLRAVAEQAVAGLVAAAAGEPGETVAVSLRGDHGGRIVTFPATPARIDPADEAWAELVPQLAGKRLNGSGGAEDLAARWSATCAVIRLSPAGPSAAMPEDAQLESPRPTPATRIPRRPFRLHKVRGAKKKA